MVVMCQKDTGARLKGVLGDKSGISQATKQILAVGEL